MRRSHPLKRLLAVLLVFCMILPTCSFVLADDGTQVVYEVNLAAGKTVSANSDANLSQYFRQVYLTDGVTACGNGNFGYSSAASKTTDFASPVTVTVDLGGQYAFNQLVLHPRNDVVSTVAGESSPHYPVDFTVESSTDGVEWVTVKTVTANPNPDGSAQTINLDPTEGRYVRLSVTKVDRLTAGETQYYVQLAELEVYNREVIVPQPSEITAYTIDFDFRIESDNQGFCFGMANSGTFVLWQVSSFENGTEDGIMLRPHFKSGGKWTAYPGGPGNVTAVDITEAVGYKASEIEGKVIHERIVVDGANVKTYFGPDAENLTLAADYDHTAPIALHKIGFRHSNDGAGKSQEIASYDNIVVKDASGNVIYAYDFESGSVGFTSANGEVSVADGWLRVGATAAVSEQVYTMIEMGEALTDVPYGEDAAQKLDIQLPVGDGDFPVVLYFHDGTDKADISEARTIVEALVGKGCAVVSANYRLTDGLHDAKAAVRFLRANAETYGFDPDRIAVFGTGVGGHLALLTGLTNSTEDNDTVLAAAAHCPEAVEGVSLTDYVNAKTLPIYLADDEGTALSTELAEALSAYGISKVDTYFPETFENNSAATNAVTTFLTKWFEPTVTLPGSVNSQAFSSVNLNNYANATVNLQYADDSAAQKLHIVTPIEGEGPYPTIVFVHGGGFIGGNSSNGSQVWTCWAGMGAVEKGYAVAFVDYRLGGEAKYPAPIHDIKTAIRYLRANADTYNLDTERFAIWGESAGSHLASFTALTSNDPAYEDLSMGYGDYSSAVQACVAWYGINDLTTDFNNQKNWTSNLLGFTVSQNRDACWDASPQAHVKETSCPFYLQHGLADTTVDPQDSVALYEALVAATGEEQNRLELFPGLIHGPGLFFSEENIGAICAWLDDMLDVPERVEDENLALGKAVATNSDVNMPNAFRPTFVTDGVKLGISGNFGYSSRQFASADISATPVAVMVDLGEEMDFNEVVLFPRSDVLSVDGSSPSFPRDFYIQVSSDRSVWETIYTVEDTPNPNGAGQSHAFPTVNARYVQIVVTEVGVQPVGGVGYYLQFNEMEVYDRDDSAAAAVDALIEAIDVADKATIEAARAAYEALSQKEKAFVAGLADLEAAELYWKTVNESVSLILTGDDVISAFDEEAVYTLSAQGMNSLATMHLTFAITDEYLSEPVAQAADGWLIVAQTWAEGKLNVIICNNDGANGEGDILTITAKPVKKAGSASVSVVYAELAAYLDEGETFVSADLTAASAATKVTYSIYDLNQDGVVNQLDLTRGQRAYGTDNKEADVTKDGKVDIDDLILILLNFDDPFV